MDPAPANRLGISISTSSRAGSATAWQSTGTRSPATGPASASWPNGSARCCSLSEFDRGGVVDDQLHRVAAAIGVAPQVAGDVHRTAPRGGEKLSERRVGDPEGDR